MFPLLDFTAKIPPQPGSSADHFDGQNGAHVKPILRKIQGNIAMPRAPTLLDKQSLVTSSLDHAQRDSEVKVSRITHGF